MKKIILILVMVMIAAGFDRSLLQGQAGDNTAQITIKNQFSLGSVQFYVNGTFICAAAANSSCTGRVKIGQGPYKLEAWGSNGSRVIASHTLDTLAPGTDNIWETGNVELNPIPRQCMIAMYNPFDFPVRFYINDVYQGYSLGGPGLYYATQVECNKGPYKLEARKDNGDPVSSETVGNLEPGAPVFNWHPKSVPVPEPPSDQIKKPKGGMGAGTKAGIIAMGGFVTYWGLWKAGVAPNIFQRGNDSGGGSGSGVDCQSYYVPSKCIGPAYANVGYTYDVPVSCSCFTGTQDTGRTEKSYSGAPAAGGPFKICSGCP